MTTHEGISPPISIWERYPSLKEIPEDGFPKHVLIIPDGNRRSASKLQRASIFGHKQGIMVLQEILRDLRELPIEIVTIWGFSADNWKREQKEVRSLMVLMDQAIKRNLSALGENGVRFVHLGRKDRISPNLRETIERAERKTAQNSKQTLCLAIDFGGMDQEVRMMEAARRLSPDTQITPELVEALRDGQGIIPPADLLIRTSVEGRTSDIGWLNGANTELYFIEDYFPEIGIGHIVEALVDFSKRQRRMGA